MSSSPRDSASPPIPADVVAIADYEPLARSRVTESAWAYLAGGAADELTLRRNRDAFDGIRLQTRALRDLRGGSTSLELFGRTLAHPVLLAPVASHCLFHPDGELAVARAASAMSAGLVLSAQSTTSLEEVAAATSKPWWFQLYLHTDRTSTMQLVRRAEHAHVSAFVVTVDAPVSGIRNREARAGFALPPHLSPVNLAGATMPPVSASRPGESPLFGTGLLETAPTWNDIRWLRDQTDRPIVLKGIMSADDVERGLECGVNGIIVSNHGGRVLDTMPAAIEMLPSVVRRVNGRCPVLVDGGIRRGTDILKALAFGATAALIGRPYVWGLATAGDAGVAHVIHILRGELEVAMALTGCRGLADVDRSVIWNDPQG